MEPLNELGNSISYKIACTSSKDFASTQSDQSFRCPPEDALDHKLHSAMRRLWLDCADAQADLSLRWAHMQSCRNCCAKLINNFKSILKDRIHTSLLGFRSDPLQMYIWIFATLWIFEIKYCLIKRTAFWIPCISYAMCPKYSDGYTWANSVDPDICICNTVNSLNKILFKLKRMSFWIPYLSFAIYPKYSDG